ncbi:GGDEF domain-containing response regulator [Candidatus Magnetomonas plexicatena]|uniref:GGDEF domain-containing response regulator n=1 Tax=Candidatus Magnetomonas plexicatena TaxID=2552947 RepID=UPI001C78D91D|nr:diguanylate cyclase [Nitrospirales bacterium LBB_01]
MKKELFADSSIDPYLNRTRVLYVEDEDMIRESMVRILKRRIKTIYTGANGREGLELFKQHNPDVVITDIRMPQMSGIEMAQGIREIDEDVPVILTTAYNDEDFFLKAIEIGVVKYIKKPINSTDLFAVLVKVAKSISQQKEIDAKNEFIKTILDNNPAYVLLTDEEDIFFMNKSFLHFLGYDTFDEFKSNGLNINRFLVVKDDAFYKNKSFTEWMTEVIHRKEKQHIVYLAGKEQLKSEAGAYLISATQIPEIQHTDRYLITFTDISGIESERRRFQDMACKDPLTSIFNRKKFEDELEKEILRTERYKTSLTMMIFDIDHFKSINDTYGHQAGDAVLIELTEIVTANVRKTDIFARYGGEEFVVITPETTLIGAIELAEKLRELIQNNNFSHVGHVTCSFGVSEYMNSESSHTFIKKADYALYIAKNNGRNRVQFVEKEHSLVFNLPF